MRPPPATGGYRLLALGAFVLGLLVRLAVAWEPLPILISKVLPDAAFNYLTIGRRLVEGFSIRLPTPTASTHCGWARWRG